MQLKPITQAGIPAALQKAERYRLLNDSSAAESICLDVLEVDPHNQAALVMLLLTHLLIFAPYPRRTRVLIIVGAFLSAALDEGAGWLVRFVHPGFAVLKLAAFVSLQGILAFLLIGLALFLRSGAGSRGELPIEASRFKSRD